MNKFCNYNVWPLKFLLRLAISCNWTDFLKHLEPISFPVLLRDSVCICCAYLQQLSTFTSCLHRVKVSQRSSGLLRSCQYMHTALNRRESWTPQTRSEPIKNPCGYPIPPAFAFQLVSESVVCLLLSTMRQP